MNKPDRDWREAVRAAATSLPDPVRDQVEAVALSDGVIPPGQVAQWCTALDRSVEELMAVLLPVAAATAHPPISSFYVGAVVAASAGPTADRTLYMGSNLEFAQSTLMASIHAEQSAVLRAWQDGAEQLHNVTVNAAPCGHCRQFLNEVRTGPDGLVVITPDGRVDLDALLPSAFGPEALGSAARLFEPFDKSLSFVDDGPQGPLWARALAAAERSYAPYSDRAAGIALQLRGGEIATGQVCENVAFNPSVSPLQTVAATVGARFFEGGVVQAAVLVEEAGIVSHFERDRALLEVVAPGVELHRREVAAAR